MMPKPDVESAEAREQEAAFGDEREEASEEASESSQIWEHVKTLRRRVAGFN